MINSTDVYWHSYSRLVYTVNLKNNSRLVGVSLVGAGKCCVNSTYLGLTHGALL